MGFRRTLDVASRKVAVVALAVAARRRLGRLRIGDDSTGKLVVG